MRYATTVHTRHTRKAAGKKPDMRTVTDGRPRHAQRWHGRRMIGSWSFPRRGGWRPWLRRAVLTCAAGTLIGVFAVAASTAWLRDQARAYEFTEASVPTAPVALVLGAQVYSDGVPSPFLASRLAIAQRLLDAGKVQAILVSGDHGQWAYDEPDAMREWLIEHAVPAGRIVLDHAGFDTYDSCARAARVFGVRQAIVVTQSYHLARAVALCRRLGVQAVGVGDDTARQYAEPWRASATREYGACVKAVLDLASGRDPVYLGRHETGVEDALRSG
jgi:vancomycin permeability regulator SanA